MCDLLDAGLNVARFNFSHGDHAGHQKVLDRFRSACAKKGAEMQERLGLSHQPTWACLLDTKGPEIRTAMLKDGKDIQLEAGQELTPGAIDRTTIPHHLFCLIRLKINQIL